MKAIWNNEIIAETKQTMELEGKHYFPQNSVKLEYLSSSNDCEECEWKELVTTYDLAVAGQDLPNAVSYYPNHKEDAVSISGFMAFSDQVQIVAQ